ncbi:phage replication initiation protein [Croceifilum oryzae]|uniref:Phage replication initiation protein n=1 Tax=Croceifilum oryzae TaxID=1553429 RepID=A0AAJ1WTF5_9BACL|nr:replication initiation factor domain-containing protein [Croceifilum oryzae]MDQ0417988.1 phage replication initiation protein [Croceifilum oryzae]
MLTKSISPPSCNTGAQNTSEQGLRALIDWFRASFQNIGLEDLVVGILDLKMDDFFKMDSGMYGYRKSLRLGNIAVYYEGNENMGICLEMGGQGCREYEGHGKRSWVQLFAMVLDLNSNITRIDLAIDDFRGYFLIPEIEKKIKKGEVQSKFKEATNYEKIRLKDGYRRGQTLYIGSTSSLLKVRFYDKLKEALGNDKESELEGIEFWNRTELELKDERATKVAWLLVNGMKVGEVATGVLNHYVRFTVQGTDSNKSRWKTWKKWEQFIGDAEKIKLTELPKERTVETRLEWLDRQVAPTLATIVEAESEEFLLDFVKKAVSRLTEKDFMMIDQYKEVKQERDDELWKQRRKIAWKLMGIEKDETTGEMRSKYPPLKDQTAI